MGAAGAVGAAWPEAGVFQSAGFCGLAALAALSLSVTVIHSFRRRRTGSLLFHAGLLAVIVAGLLRAGFSTDAAVDLIEGETLPPTAGAWSAQWQGLLARPIALDRPVTLEAVAGERYDGGDLRDLRVRLSSGELAINRQADVGDCRLYLGREFGPAALLEWSSQGRQAALLSDTGHGTYEGVAAGPDGIRVCLRANAERPSSLEVRVMRGGGLLAVADLRPGQTLPLPGGPRLTLHGTPMWVRLHGSRDPSLWLAYLGFAMVLTGAVLLFALQPAPMRRAASIPQSVLQPSVAIMALLLVLVAAGCRRSSSTEDARRLVVRYNDAVSEAYRRGDVRLADGVVGPAEGKKLTGLIGVRLDLGLTLDSQLLSLDVLGVERGEKELRVRTRESWKYCDRKIGTGEIAGEEGLDSYEMLYIFQKEGREWLVNEIQFTAPPKVGRKPTTWAMERPKAAQP